jgi:cell pole-organizing protein PopZ
VNDPKTQQEPSMEEILASIRRIISEDTQAEGDAPAKSESAKGGNGAVPEPDDNEIIELTEVVEEPPAAAAPVSAAEPVPASAEPAAETKPVEVPAAAVEPAETQAEPAATAEPVEAPAEPEAAPPDEAEAPAATVDPSDAALFGTSEAAAEPTDSGGREDRVISEHAADAAMRAFGSLTSSLQGSGGGGLPLGEGSRTIEDIVRDLLRPMLREWLDANLPEVVQRIVQKEVREMVRRAEDL